MANGSNRDRLRKRKIKHGKVELYSKMEDLKALLIGVLGGLIVIGLSRLYRVYRKKNLREDIEFVEYEKNHLTEMKRSSVEMNRSSFRGLFAVLMLFALANLLPAFFNVIGIGVITKIGEVINLFIWGAVFILALRFWRRYENLKNFKEATTKMGEKLELHKSKYENS